MTLRLYNTLTRTKEEFRPIDPDNVRMYVCGPTVYDFAHIGNARPIIVFDLLYRLLRHEYGADHVTYVRNITDVDDKINARAAEEHPDLPLNEAIRQVTEATERQFHEDIRALGVLDPTREPRATEHVRPMIAMIEALIARGHAYVAEGHVLFDVGSMPDYGRLSGRSLDEMIAGARIEVAPYKREPTDFVLWKPSTAAEPGWDSPWGRGRPGWHIECSAMSAEYLGDVFDIHGGGIDLVFPHHENEIAQSRCAHGTPVMANVWMHNGFLQVEGQKMSKSLGNFVTIRDVLRGWHGRYWFGSGIRLSMLGTHYRQPVDWTFDALVRAHVDLNHFLEVCDPDLFDDDATFEGAWTREPRASPRVVACLQDDLNTPGAITIMRETFQELDRAGRDAAQDLRASFLDDVRFLGLATRETLRTRWGVTGATSWGDLSPEALDRAMPLLSKLNAFHANGENGAQLEAVSSLNQLGFSIQIDEFGRIAANYEGSRFEHSINALIDARLAARREKKWAEADRIRAEIEAMGVMLMDGKDPATGQIVTTWEVRQ